jgi:hypothetical protein
MPLWLGANAQPGYRPNSACCTTMNTKALTGGEHQQYHGQITGCVQTEGQRLREAVA